MIRYSRHIEPDIPQQRTAAISLSLSPRNVIVPQLEAGTEQVPTSLEVDMRQSAEETLLLGVEQLELTAPNRPPPEARKSKSLIRKPKKQPVDSSMAPAMPLLTALGDVK